MPLMGQTLDSDPVTSPRSAHISGVLCSSSKSCLDSVVVELNDCLEHTRSLFTDVPTSGAWDFGDQAAHVQTLEQPPHCGAMTTTFPGIVGCPEEQHANVGVAKAPYQMVAVQHRPEQLHIRTSGRVEARITATGNHIRLGELLDLSISGCRVVTWSSGDRSSGDTMSRLRSRFSGGAKGSESPWGYR